MILDRKNNALTVAFHFSVIASHTAYFSQYNEKKHQGKLIVVWFCYNF